MNYTEKEKEALRKILYKRNWVKATRSNGNANPNPLEEIWIQKLTPEETQMVRSVDMLILKWGS